HREEPPPVKGHQGVASGKGRPLPELPRRGPGRLQAPRGLLVRLRRRLRNLPRPRGQVAAPPLRGGLAGAERSGEGEPGLLQPQGTGRGGRPGAPAARSARGETTSATSCTAPATRG